MSHNPGKLRGAAAAPSMRFCITGLLSTALHYAVAMSFLLLVMDSPALANGVAFTVATIFSCLMNTWWSFSRRLAAGVFVRFGLVACLGCALSMGVAGLAARAGAPNWLGILCVVAVVTPVTFLLHRGWTYR